MCLAAVDRCGPGRRSDGQSGPQGARVQPRCHRTRQRTARLARCGERGPRRMAAARRRRSRRRPHRRSHHVAHTGQQLARSQRRGAQHHAAAVGRHRVDHADPPPRSRSPDTLVRVARREREHGAGGGARLHRRGALPQDGGAVGRQLRRPSLLLPADRLALSGRRGPRCRRRAGVRSRRAGRVQPDHRHLQPARRGGPLPAHRRRSAAAASATAAIVCRGPAGHGHTSHGRGAAQQRGHQRSDRKPALRACGGGRARERVLAQGRSPRARRRWPQLRRHARPQARRDRRRGAQLEPLRRRRRPGARAPADQPAEPGGRLARQGVPRHAPERQHRVQRRAQARRPASRARPQRAGDREGARRIPPAVRHRPAQPARPAELRERALHRATLVRQRPTTTACSRRRACSRRCSS